MRTKVLLFIVVITSLNNLLFGQSQWRFYVEFEEGTGQKDTLWMVYDTSATTHLVDTNLGEGHTPLDYSKFNVWILNAAYDTTKTVAHPFTIFPDHMLYAISAINFTYPIIIRWDTSLFHSPLLPIQPNNFIQVARIDNGYFFFINNDPPLQAYNMLIDNSAFAPYYNFGSQSQFPITISTNNGPVGIQSISLKNSIKLFPNPSNEKIRVESFNSIISIDLIDMRGVILKSILNVHTPTEEIDISDLPNGIYCLLILDKKSHIVKMNFIKR